MTKNSVTRIAVITISWLIVLVIVALGYIVPDVEVRAYVDGQASLAGPPTATPVPSATATYTQVPTGTPTPTSAPDFIATDVARADEAMVVRDALLADSELLQEEQADLLATRTALRDELVAAVNPFGQQFRELSSIRSDLEDIEEELSVNAGGQTVVLLQLELNDLAIDPGGTVDSVEISSVPPGVSIALCPGCESQTETPLAPSPMSTVVTEVAQNVTTPTATPLPTRPYVVRGDYPQEVKAGDDAHVNLHLVREGSQFIIEIDDNDNITFTDPLSPQPEGTPNVPPEQAFGPDLIPCAKAHLSSSAFTVSGPDRGCRSLLENGLSWRWTILNVEHVDYNKPQNLDLLIVFHWRAATGGNSLHEIDAWQETKKVIITKSAFDDIQPMALMASVGWSLLFSVVNIPFLYSLLRNRRREPDAPDEININIDQRYQTVEEQINVADDYIEGDKPDETTPGKET